MKKSFILTITTLLFFLYHLEVRACSGTPTAGTIVASQTSNCAPFIANLFLSGATSDVDVTYQWQSSPDGATYTPIGGATNTTYAAPVSSTTYYNVIVTCLTSGLTATTPGTEITIYTLATNTGAPSVCAGFSTPYSNTTPGGTWSSSNPTVASINTSTGVVTGISYGTANISYNTGAGCSAVSTIAVDSLPPAITGTAIVCVGATTALGNGVPGGSWSSSNTLVASAAATTGIITGVSAGIANITYTAPTGCYNLRTLTVNPAPGPIMGTALVCEGATTNLVDGTPGGAWTSANTSIATVNLVTGVVTGVTAGTVNISYTLVSTGCSVRQLVTVNASPAPISGAGHLCLGANVTLSSTTAGGLWSSSNTAIATIGSSSGVAFGVSLGNVTITYTLPGTGCMAVRISTVHALPTVYTLSGSGSYCAGGTGVVLNLSGSDIGVSYLLHYGTSVAGFTVGTGSPLSFGPLTTAATYTAVATDAVTGCKNNMAGTATITITPLTAPAVTISTGMGDSVCEGSSVTLTPLSFYGGSAPAYTWSVNGTMVSTGSTYSFLPAHGDVVTIEMTSNAPCPQPDTATDTLVLSVLSNELPMVSVSLIPSDTICQSYLATYTAHPTYGGASPFYKWYVNGSFWSNGPTMTYAPVNNDLVRVRMASNYLCRTVDTVSSGNVKMTVIPFFAPGINIISTHNLQLNAGQIDTLIAVVTNAGPTPTYQWLVNGDTIAGATTNTYVSTFNNGDSVTCHVIGSSICAGVNTFDWVFITIKNLGVNTLAVTDIRMMPNPNNGAFAVKGYLGSSTDEPVMLEVTDMLGQVVLRRNIIAIGGKINEQIATGGTLANGMYMLNVRRASENKVFHFVVEQ
ncbi:MAG: Ig-like domain-containing protein [Bacteroidota bacterium]